MASLLKALILLSAATVAAMPRVFGNEEMPWLNPENSTEVRIESLIKAMTVEEKISQLMDSSRAIDRLNIPQYNWWNECLHGVARNGRATVFPQAIAFGASFNPGLVQEVAEAISDEARAKFVVAQKSGNRSRYAGLTFWSPNVNIFRDPRWGRGQETYGEDPYLTSRIGVAFVKGLQGTDPQYLKVAACAKHFAVHSGPEALRHVFDAQCSPRDLRETYLPAFKALVEEAKVEIIMGAYNRFMGDPCCSSKYLLTDILRGEWDFDGHVVSDCGAIRDIYTYHKAASSPEEAAAMALQAGTDLECGDVFKALQDALLLGLVTEDDLDVALRRVFGTRIRLGLLDKLEDVPYNAIPPEAVGSAKHRQLARNMAKESIVLLKNSNNVLPLAKDIRNLYVTGPNAASEECLLGNYYGLSEDTVTILDGIVGKVSLGTTVNYKHGILPYRTNVNPIDWTTGEAKRSDACIAVIGLDGLWEGEEGEAIASPYKGDKTNSLRLPENQVEFIRNLRKDSGKPLIVVITAGSPLALPEIYDLADAVILAWYPGQEGGNAVADILFGDVNPSGRLPFTVPFSIKDLPPYEEYSMRGRTYRYMEVDPQFPFGFGLSYSTFHYEGMQLNKTLIGSDETLSVEVSVTNNSSIPGKEVIQIYLTQPGAGKSAPIRKLVAFRKVRIDPGTTRTDKFSLEPEMLRQYDTSGKPVVLNEAYLLTAAGSSPINDSRDLGMSNSITRPFAVTSLKRTPVASNLEPAIKP